MEIVSRTTTRMGLGDEDAYTRLVELDDGRRFYETKHVRCDVPESVRQPILDAHFAQFEEWLMRALRKDHT